MKGGSFFLDNSDEASVGRLRQLTTHDREDVADAYKGRKKGPNKHSFIPLIAIVIFCLFYMLPIYENYPTAHSCLAILILGAVLWGTETIPSYITAYLMPLLCVWFAIGYDDNTGKRIPSNRMAVIISAKFTDPIIFVFLGSMTMSAALTKLKITERVSTYALSRISKKPSVVLFALMLLNFTTAAFLSNIASTTLALSFSLPIIRDLDPDDNFIKALLFGLAWSGNAGGMPTTISSSQNILAIKFINESGRTAISFIEWLSFAGPIGTVCLIFFWAFLKIKFPCNKDYLEIKAPKIGQNNEKWTWKHNFTCIITGTTILMWALQESFPAFLGHVGITSLLPIVSLFSSKILDSEDFGKLRWSTLSLMGGGLALGEAMKVSGLLDLLASTILNLLRGISLWVVMMLFLVVQSVLVSIINHTSAAAILYPVLNSIGEELGKPNLVLTLSAMIIGCAQLFHISSFPNALISGVQRHSQKDHSHLEQEPFLPGSSFFTVGWPSVLGSVIIIGTFGYFLVLLLGF